MKYPLNKTNVTPIVCGLLLATMVSLSSSSNKTCTEKATKVSEEPVPSWTHKPPLDDEMYGYFVGVGFIGPVAKPGEPDPSTQQARRVAFDDAKLTVGTLFGERFSREQTKYKSSRPEKSSGADTTDAAVKSIEKQGQSVLISKVQPANYYDEEYGPFCFKSYALVKIPKTEIDYQVERQKEEYIKQEEEKQLATQIEQEASLSAAALTRSVQPGTTNNAAIVSPIYREITPFPTLKLKDKKSLALAAGEPGIPLTDNEQNEYYKARLIDSDKDVAPEQTIGTWEKLAASVPAYRRFAGNRIAQWEEYLERRDAISRTRGADWASIMTLRKHDGSPAHRETEAKYKEFIARYGDRYESNPYILEIDALSSTSHLNASKRAAALKARSPYEGMALIPAGEFLMGAPESEESSDAHPQHKVYMSDFYIDKYEVTNQCYTYIKNHPRAKRCPKAQQTVLYPRTEIGRKDAADFCKHLGKRLPTEAEWEKSARGGGTSLYGFGDDIQELENYAWYDKNSLLVPHPVGKKSPNDYGAYDLYGNVWEWVSDDYDAMFYQNSPTKNPVNSATDSPGVIRGGGFRSPAQDIRAWTRLQNDTKNKTKSIGFRCVLSVPSKKPSSFSQN